ncbi:hypothetical protein WJS89_00340 [Sphingomicrobium sp. XHP0235]|uniref:hypothetical protein n=1 Tax=Sphingomicrobium aquimarinum TaxID=3133971 RepID=UPI0031FE5193
MTGINYDPRDLPGAIFLKEDGKGDFVWDEEIERLSRNGRSETYHYVSRRGFLVSNFTEGTYILTPAMTYFDADTQTSVLMFFQAEAGELRNGDRGAMTDLNPSPEELSVLATAHKGWVEYMKDLRNKQGWDPARIAHHYQAVDLRQVTEADLAAAMEQGEQGK